MYEKNKLFLNVLYYLIVFLLSLLIKINVFIMSYYFDLIYMFSICVLKVYEQLTQIVFFFWQNMNSKLKLSSSRLA